MMGRACQLAGPGVTDAEEISRRRGVAAARLDCPTRGAIIVTMPRAHRRFPPVRRQISDSSPVVTCALLQPTD